MIKPPSFPFYVNNWLASSRIAAMTPAQEGAYIRLLAYAWNEATCSLPADDAALAMLSRLGADWPALGGPVRACFTERDGRLYSERLCACRSEDEDYRSEQRAKARARWAGHTRGTTQAIPRHIPRDNLRECSESESESESDTEKRDTPPTPLKGGVDDAPGKETGKLGEQETHKGADNGTPKGANDTTAGTPPKRNRRAVVYDADFLAFWNVYPRKDGKEPAARAWAARPDRPPTEELVRIVRERALSSDWRRDRGKWVPHAATWLNQGRWQDAGISLPPKPDGGSCI